MEGQLEHPPYGPILAAPEESAIRYHLTSGTTGQDADPGARLDEGLGVDRRDVVLRLLGLRHPALGRRLLRVLLRDVRRLLGRALRVREDRLPRAPRRQHDDRGAREADPRHERDRRLLDADLRAAHGAGGARPGHRPRQRPGEAPDPVGRAGRLDPRDEEADRGAVGSEGRRHRGDDRARHDHDVRVREPAGRRAHHRGPLHRGGHRSRSPASRSPTASRASGSSRRSAAASSP